MTDLHAHAHAHAHMQSAVTGAIVHTLIAARDLAREKEGHVLGLFFVRLYSIAVARASKSPASAF